MVTRANIIRETLENEIISGDLQPGDRLDEPQLKGRFDASRTPVREALVELSSMGLVEMWPHRSAIVAEVSVHQVIQMYEVLAELEGLCAGLAARRMAEDELIELESIHQEIRRAIENGDRGVFPSLNKNFHDMIHRGAHNEILENQVAGLNRRLAPYRRIFHEVPHDLSIPYAEHQAVVVAIQSRDVERADQIFKDHTSLRADRITDFIAAFERRFEKRSA